MEYYWKCKPSTTENRELYIESGTTNMTVGKNYQLLIKHGQLMCDIYTEHNSTRTHIGIIQTESETIQNKYFYFTGIPYDKIIISFKKKNAMYGYFKIYDVELKSQKTYLDISEEYRVSNTGITNYGVPMDKINYRYNDDKVIKYGDSLYDLNIQDTILFDAYYKYRKKYNNTISDGLSSDSLITEYYNDTNNVLNFDFNEQDKNEFRRWNQELNTTTTSFKRQAGLQIFTKDVDILKNNYHNDFSGGTFYNGDFYGIWKKGKWGKGRFNGWNDTVPNGTMSLSSPIQETNNILNANSYHKNIEYLKNNKKYYDIPPWEKNTQ